MSKLKIRNDTSLMFRLCLFLPCRYLVLSWTWAKHIRISFSAEMRPFLLLPLTVLKGGRSYLHMWDDEAPAQCAAASLWMVVFSFRNLELRRKCVKLRTRTLNMWLDCSLEVLSHVSRSSSQIEQIWGKVPENPAIRCVERRKNTQFCPAALLGHFL